MTKMTIKEQFVMVNEVLEEAGRKDLVEFINGRIDLLNKKSSSRKATKTQEANEGIKATILATLEGANPMTVTEIMSANEELGGFSNQKISALLRQLVNEEKVVKTIDKKVSRFSIR